MKKLVTGLSAKPHSEGEEKAAGPSSKVICSFLELILHRLLKNKMVPKAGLEPARLTPLPPQDSVSTNSTTWA